MNHFYNKRIPPLAAVIIIFICFSASPAIGCGVPQTVSGQIIASNFLEQIYLSRTRVALESEVPTDPVRVARVSVFGYFYFPDTTPCANFSVTAFVPAERGADLEINFEPPARMIYVPGDMPVENVNFEMMIGADGK